MFSPQYSMYLVERSDLGEVPIVTEKQKELNLCLHFGEGSKYVNEVL